MKMLDQARSAFARCVDAGRDKADGLRAKRQRSSLIGELGEATYAQSKGVSTSSAEVDRIIAELDALDGPNDDTTGDDESE